MPSMRKLALAAASASIAVAAPFQDVSPPAPLVAPQDVPVNQFTSSNANGAPYLNNIAQSKGKLWLGTASDIPNLDGTAETSDLEYMTILNDTKIFGEITPANAMKWLYTEPEYNVYNYTPGDYVTSLAEDHGKFVRCHNLAWDSEYPTWLTEGAQNGTFNNATMVKILTNHIHNLIEHWGGRCYSWDVVNEALDGNGNFDAAGGGNPFRDIIGTEYFYIAFKAATAAVKKTTADIKLYYNDYGIENTGTKASAALSLLQSVRARGYQVDGAGFESHFVAGAGYTPSYDSLVENMAAFGAANFDVAITELDIRLNNITTDNNPAGYANQASRYYDTIAACMASSNCIGMTVWDFVDKYSWIQPDSPFVDQAYPDIYFSNYTRKPAYTAIANALNGVKCKVCDGTQYNA